jgi:hypothetical protein
VFSNVANAGENIESGSDKRTERMRNMWDVGIWRKGQENRENEEYVGRRNLEEGTREPRE